MSTTPSAPEYFRLIKARAVRDRVLEQYQIDIRFEATTEVTPRTVEVVEAFGGGVDKTQRSTINLHSLKTLYPTPLDQRTTQKL
jgi:hypothetical protein